KLETNSLTRFRGTQTALERTATKFRTGRMNDEDHRVASPNQELTLRTARSRQVSFSFTEDMERILLSMNKYVLVSFAAVAGLLSIVMPIRIHQTVHAQENSAKDFVPPAVFQAAGPDRASIQSSVDGFRKAVDPDNQINGNNPGPL